MIIKHCMTLPVLMQNLQIASSNMYNNDSLKMAYVCSATGIYKYFVKKIVVSLQQTPHLQSALVLSASHTRNQSQDTSSANTERKFDEKMLQYLVCPLSKKELRYDREKNELICDELDVAYPIINGIPNLVPQDARYIRGKAPPHRDNTTN